MKTLLTPATVGDKTTYTLAQTSDATLVGTHEVTVTPKQGTTDLTAQALKISILIYDDCEAATVTLPKLKDLTWIKGAAKQSTEFTRFVTNPVNCKDRMLYELVIPTAAADLVKSASAGLKLEITGTTKNAKAWAKHSVTLKVKGPGGTDIANGSVTFSVTLKEKADDKTTTTTTATAKAKATSPKVAGTSIPTAVKEALNNLTNVASVAATAGNAATRATGGPRPGRSSASGGAGKTSSGGGKKAGGGGKKAGSGKSAGGGGDKKSGTGSSSPDGTGTDSSGGGDKSGGGDADSSGGGDGEAAGGDEANESDNFDAGGADTGALDFGL